MIFSVIPIIYLYMNRSYYNINSSNIISAKRVPSLTPPKAYPTSLSKEKT